MNDARPSVGVFGRRVDGSKKSLYAVTTEGRLAQLWDTNRWNLDFPAELAGREDVRFAAGAPGIVVKEIGNNKKYLYAITEDGQIAQLWDTNRWHLDFPLDSITDPRIMDRGLRFTGTPLATTLDLSTSKREMYVLTRDGEITRITNADGPWKVGFPYEAAHPGYRFAGSLAGYAALIPGELIPGPQPDDGGQRPPGADPPRDEPGTGDPQLPEPADQTDRLGEDLPVVTSFLGLFGVSADGQLMQIGPWDYPARMARREDLRFAPSPCVFPQVLNTNKKSLYALTADGRLAQVWDTNNGWNLDFPAELAGYPELRFTGSPAVFGRDPEHNKKSLYAVTTDGRLAQVWDTNRWNLDFPAELAGRGDLRFAGSPAVLGRDAAHNKKAVYAVTIDGHLAQLWDTDRGWRLDFPAALAGHGELLFLP